MTPRRRRPPVLDQPLFDEDWWASDQQLFQDSVARQASQQDSPAKPRRRTTLQNKTATADNGYSQPMLPWFEEPDPAGDADEPLHSDGAGALGQVAAVPIRGDQRSRQLLLGFVDAGGAADRQPGGGAGRGRPAGRGLSGEGGAAGRSSAPSGADRPVRGDPAGPGAGGR